MKIPVIVWIAVFCFALPLLVAGVRRRSLDRASWLMVGFYAVLVVENIMSWVWSHYIDRTNNLIVPRVSLPFEAVFVLGSIAELQVKPLARTAVRVAIPLYVLGWLFSFFFVETPGTFSIVAAPLLGLLVLGSALLAFVSRLLLPGEAVLETTWGWLLPGIAIFFASNATGSIMMALAMRWEDAPMMVDVMIVRSSIYLLSTLLISWGLFWTTRARSSGASS